MKSERMFLYLKECLVGSLCQPGSETLDAFLPVRYAEKASCDHSIQLFLKGKKHPMSGVFTKKNNQHTTNNLPHIQHFLCGHTIRDQYVDVFPRECRMNDFCFFRSAGNSHHSVDLRHLFRRYSDDQIF